MSFTTKAALAEIKHRPGRFVAVSLAIIIGSLFAVATTVFSATAGRAVEVAVAENLQNTDVVVNVTDGSLSGIAQTTDQILSVSGVDAVAPVAQTMFQMPGSRPISGFPASAVIADPQLAWEKLAEGRFPTASNEIALSPDLASQTGSKVGGLVTLVSIDGQNVTFTVVGITDPNPATATFSLSMSWVSLDYLTQASDSAVGGPPGILSSYLVRASGDPAQVVADLNSVLPEGATALTAQEARDAIVAQVSQGTVAITVLLGCFAAVALVVAGIVIANTFSILLAQRRRQIALQRLVGATSQQMSRQILLEALIIGVGGTVIGGLLGIGVGYIAANVFGAAAGGLTIDPVTVVIAAIATISVTVLAAYFPIRKAVTTSPIEALRPLEATSGGRSLPGWRIGLAVVMLVSGLAILAFGVMQHELVIATFGGLVSVVGLLAGTQLLVLPLGRLLRPIGAMFGMPGRIAARDVTRHASRASNTVVAMIVGVGLISMIQVAASITRTSILQDAANSEYREQIESIISIMTNVATGLLAVTAVIAVVGIANTLALSVIERKRESGLLRALGVQRGQLRSMISIEAAILSLIGGLTGVLLGLGYGTAAAYTVIGARGEFVWDVPWDRLAIFVVVALIGGLVASILPAMRSGRVSPVEALATE